MAKSIHNDVLDAALNIIKNNCTSIVACSAEPTTYAEGSTTYALADVTVDSADFTVADGDTSGRKITLGAQSSVLVDTTGTITHLAFLDVANSKLLYVTTTTSKAVTASDTINIAAVDLELSDPA